jgi:N-acetylglucosamine-6-sulfatase
MLLSSLQILALLVASVLGEIPPQNAAPKRPNVIFILTDDQDAKLNSLDYMPSLQKHLLAQGTHFEKHYCTVAVCCPSRVSLLTGKNAHNTNVTNVVPPYGQSVSITLLLEERINYCLGGYPKFILEGHNKNWVPLWLQNAGVATYYVGKLMNHQHITNYNKPYPSGFTAHVCSILHESLSGCLLDLGLPPGSLYV